VTSAASIIRGIGRGERRRKKEKERGKNDTEEPSIRSQAQHQRHPRSLMRIDFSVQNNPGGLQIDALLEFEGKYLGISFYVEFGRRFRNVRPFI
jgi:hypothetical protein